MGIRDTNLTINQYVKKLDRSDKSATYYACPKCATGEVRVDNAVFYGRCNECNATIVNYVPEEHQEAFHMSRHTYRMLIGGFASGKTTAAVAEDALHVLSIPNSTFLITAPTLQQVREAVLPELEKFIPPWFIIGGKCTGNPPVYHLINGAKILIYASDDETKIRSLNLTGFHIEEGSGVKPTVFHQLQTRLRSKAAIIYNEDGREVGNRFMGIISTNPEDAWIKDQFLLRSDIIVGSKTADVSMYERLRYPVEERAPSYASFVSTSFDNRYLPIGTIERISAGRDERWKRKYLYSVLDTREGLVYPSIFDHFEEPFPVPDTWKRIIGYDPGIGDPTASLLCAIDPKTNIIHCYDEYYKEDGSITEHGKTLVPMIKPYELAYPIQADPSVRNRSNQTGHTYKGYFKTVTGLLLKEANNDILYGIEKVKDYLYEGRIKFFNNLVFFKLEASKYKFPTVKVTSGTNTNKPVDKDNHLMDCLRYLVSPLPRNPIDFKGVAVQKDVLLARSGFKNRNIFNKDDVNKEYNKAHVRKWS